MCLRKSSLILLTLFLTSFASAAQISEQANFIYFAVPKVGTTTIHSIFSSKKMQPFVEMTHLPLTEYNQETHQKYFKFAFVRNPWDRVVSCYFNKVVTKNYMPFRRCFGKSFTAFVHYLKTRDLKNGDCHIRLQTQFFPPLEEMDFIGHIEDFSRDFYCLMAMLGLRQPEIPRKNATSHAHYSMYYTPETRDIIGELYKEDIETFGYTFEIE